MDIAIKISQLLLCLTILVVIHEFGHFLPARWFKTRVEKFYLFFNPWFSLFKKKIGETEWGIGWLPLGGYVKISGMVDESFDMDQLNSEPKDYEFRSKPAWQRLIIMVGGVTVNFIFGFFLFAMLIWKNGEEYLPNSELKYGMAVDSVAAGMGFMDGDRILKIGANDLDRFDKAQILKKIILDKQHQITVLRNGQAHEWSLTQEQVSFLTKPELKQFELFAPRIPAEIMSLKDAGATQKAGLLAGDLFLSINGQPARYIHDVNRIINKQANADFELQVLRGSDTLNFAIRSDDQGIIGVGWHPIQKFMNVEKQSYSLLASFPAGVKMGWNLLTGQLKAFSLMFSGDIKAKDSLGGFGSIANMFPVSWDWDVFWRMTAILSIILGFMNLLPIPALDGGYIVFLLIEVISGRKVPDKIIEKATFIGFILLMALMLYANGLDVIRGLK